ncbi:MAG TPA: GNAT family N-acetyltransferase, partial [Chloroflexota bacterium]|nr:GNAT family N-acetyltransferase [Chloroflexota bacterium]
MQITARPYAGAEDAERMYVLATTYPQQTMHVADLPYILSSPALHDEPQHDVALWEDERGALVGFGIVQSRMMLQLAVHPAARDHGLEARIVEWAVARFRRIAAGRAERLPYWVSAAEEDAARRAVFERAGFRQGEWSSLHLRRPLDRPLGVPAVPAGFTIRPLAGEGEVDAYVALHRAAFGTENITVAWRRRILRAPAYRPHLDLVVEAPHGRHAAFTICWLNPHAPGQSGRRGGQIEPAGTHPDFRRRGLATALLRE